MKKIIILLLFLLVVGGCAKKVETPVNTTIVNDFSIETNTTPQYSAEEIRIAEYVGNAWIDILNYTKIHNDNLSIQLKMVRNGTADRVVDGVLQEKIDNLHDYLTENISATTLVKIGADEILWQVYNLDDVLNPKNVTEVEINSRSRTPTIEVIHNAPSAYISGNDNA